nr:MULTISPECIES: hypothetical protein [unclassified Rhodococcus (in: high G+C Gram-positive bacteria)]
MTKEDVCDFVEDALFTEQRIYIISDVDHIYRRSSYPEAGYFPALAQIVR